jgi:hypothetical protein
LSELGDTERNWIAERLKAALGHPAAFVVLGPRGFGQGKLLVASELDEM